MAKVKVLSNEETKHLIKEAHNGSEDARNTLIEHNQRLVWSVAQRYKNRGYELEDIFQIGVIGLMKAVDRFDLSYDVKFSTYAVPMIIGEVQRFTRDDGIIKASRSLKEIAWRIMREDLRDEPANVIAKQLEIEIDEVKEAIRYIRSNIPRSIDETIYENDGDPITLADQIHGDVNGNWSEYLELVDAMKVLSPVQQQVIYFRYFQDLTQSDVAEKLGISQVHVSRIEAKAVKLMRHDLTKETKIATPSIVRPKKKEEPDMIKQGDIELLKKLLKETQLTYTEIQKLTDTSLSTISKYAQDLRPKKEAVVAVLEPKQIEKEKEEVLTKEQIQAGLRDEAEVKAADLLANTKMTYGEIADATGLKYGRVGYLGPKFRSAEARREIQVMSGTKALSNSRSTSDKEDTTTYVGAIKPGTGDRQKAAEMLASGRYSYAKISEESGVPVGSLTKVKTDLEAGLYKVEIDSPLNNETPVTKNVDLPSTATNDNNLQQALDEVIQKNKPTKVAEFDVEPKAERRISVRRSFDFEAEGVDVSVAEASDEISDILNLIKSMSKDKKISFSLKVRS